MRTDHLHLFAWSRTFVLQVAVILTWWNFFCFASITWPAIAGMNEWRLHFFYSTESTPPNTLPPPTSLPTTGNNNDKHPCYDLQGQRREQGPNDDLSFGPQVIFGEFSFFLFLCFFNTNYWIYVVLGTVYVSKRREGLVWATTTIMGPNDAGMRCLGLKWLYFFSSCSFSTN